MKLTITEARCYDKKKDGSALTDKNGRQKYRCVIKTTEKGNELLSGFTFKPLKAGDVIEAEVKEEEYQGQKRLAFSIVPTKNAPAESPAVLAEMKLQTAILKDIANRVEAIYLSISTHQTIASIGKKPAPEDEYSGDQPGDFDSAPSADEDDYGPLGE